MVFNPKEVTLKNGTVVILKTPEEKDAHMMLDNIISIANSTDYLLSAASDFEHYLKNISEEEAFIARKRESRDHMIAVYLDGVIIGCCSLDLHFHEKDKHRATLGIAIQKPYWDKGIGSILFDELISIAKNTEGIEQIELDVIGVNERAKHLYTKKGFVKTGDIPHQLKLKDGTYLDGETMVLFLDK